MYDQLEGGNASLYSTVPAYTRKAYNFNRTSLACFSMDGDICVVPVHLGKKQSSQRLPSYYCGVVTVSMTK